nr:hypothetical protein [Amycolatopsis sp. FDAARGOS 1241]
MPRPGAAAATNVGDHTTGADADTGASGSAANTAAADPAGTEARPTAIRPGDRSTRSGAHTAAAMLVGAAATDPHGSEAEAGPAAAHRGGSATEPGARSSAAVGRAGAEAAVRVVAAGRVWLERTAGPGPLDDLVLERFAIAAWLLGPAPQVAPPHLADPALVELVPGERAAAADRSRALTPLGLDAGRPPRVIAAGTEDGSAALSVAARGTAVGARVAVVGHVAAVLLQPREGSETVVSTLRPALSSRAAERSPAGTVRVGIGDAVPTLDICRSWLQARLAERFAVPATDPVVVHRGDLGSLTLLAELLPEHLRSHPGVRALDALGPPDREPWKPFAARVPCGKRLSCRTVTTAPSPRVWPAPKIPWAGPSTTPPAASAPDSPLAHRLARRA